MSEMSTPQLKCSFLFSDRMEAGSRESVYFSGVFLKQLQDTDGLWLASCVLGFKHQWWECARAGHVYTQLERLSQPGRGRVMFREEVRGHGRELRGAEIAGGAGMLWREEASRLNKKVIEEINKVGFDLNPFEMQ